MIGKRQFHFVSYEGTPPNPRKGLPGREPMWYLMVEGRRCPALPYDPAQPLSDADRALERWARKNAFGPEKPARPKRMPRSRAATQWWGPN